MFYVLRFVLLPFVAAFAASALATRLICRAAPHLGALDKPGAHKQHETPTPTLGGLAVFSAFLVGVMLSGPLGSKVSAILRAAAVLVGIGALDDLRGVNANIKLAVLAGTSYYLWQHGIHLNVFGWTGVLALLVTFGWIGLVSSAFNGVDNADGAAAGLASISALGAFLISWQTWQHELAVVSLVLAGSCLGFLCFNFPAPRARIFLGDSGSLFLGFGLAAVTVLGEWSHSAWKAALVGSLLVAVPLFDFLFILLVRGLEGRYRRWDDPIRMCARDHLSHRLLALGFNRRSCVLTLYLFGFLATGLAMFYAQRPDALSAEQVVRLAFFVIIAGFALKQVRLGKEAYPQHLEQ